MPLILFMTFGFSSQQYEREVTNWFSFCSLFKMDFIDVDSDDEQDNSNAWEQLYSGRNGYVFLIDARKSMVIDNEKIDFVMSFKSCLDAMMQIAREQRYDLIAFVLFGTSKSEGKFAPENVVLLENLQTPSVPYITKISHMIGDKFADIIEKYGHQESPVSLSKAISYCKSLLHHCRTKLYNKSIVIFTNHDDPCKDDETAAHAARKRAEELYEHRIDLDVIGLGAFDSSKFYKELVLTSKGELLKDWDGLDPIKKIGDVEKEISCISKKFNKHFGVFYLGKEARMKILLYKLYHEPQKLVWTSTTKHAASTDVQEPTEDVPNIKNEQDSITFDANTQKAKPEKKMNKYVKYPLIGGRHIPMTKEELKWYEPKVPKGLTLIGFRATSSIPLHLAEGESSFVVPDTRDKASTELFSVLHESCSRKNVAALCWFALTKSASPSPVFLFPVEAEEYAPGKLHPCGFQAIRIPFSDMINDCSEISDFADVEASQSQIEAIEGVIKKTTMNWSPDDFSDIEYRKRIIMIEAIAMEYEILFEDFVDGTDIDLDDISNLLGELSEEFMDCSHLPSDLLGKRMGSKETGSGTSTKEAKLIDPVSTISMIKEGKANDLTTLTLRELLRGEGIKSLSAMNKARLVEIAEKRFKFGN